MNYLAHIYLSCDDEELLIGNFISDFIANKDIEKYSHGIQRGILLHRKIDSFTDTHSEVFQANALIRESQGKYAPVVTDIYFDHFLITNWTFYSERKLSDFSNHVYKILDKNMEVYPVKLKEIVPLMIRDNFLLSCENEARLRKTFERITKRAKFPNQFHRAYDDLAEHYEELEKHFKVFFPTLNDMVRSFCDC